MHCYDPRISLDKSSYLIRYVMSFVMWRGVEVNGNLFPMRQLETIDLWENFCWAVETNFGWSADCTMAIVSNEQR